MTGVFITIFLIGSIMMFSGYCFYRYMVFIYKEGRILDLYRRLTGNYKDFFVPHDNEVSLKYLQWVLERYRQKDCIILSEIRVQQDKYGNDRNLNFIRIYKIDEGKIMKHRLFFKDFDGSIIQVYQRKAIATTNELKKIRKEAGEGSAHLYSAKHKSLNSVIKSTYKWIKNENRNFGHDQNNSMDAGGLEPMLDAGNASNLNALKQNQMRERALAAQINAENEALERVKQSEAKPLLIDTTTHQNYELDIE